MQLKPGDRIGDYEVLGVLGAGGMGSVYKVRNVISDRVEAIKLLLPNLVEHPDLKERFLREIKTSASLEHPSIAGLRTAFQNGDMLLMVMEFVEGETLDARLRHGPLPVGEAARITAQVLDALEYAHSRGVVHRDIKPANIMLSKSGGVKLLDFGIAKATTDKQITVAGTTMGSLYYMSPEQIRGEQVDQRADLYSLGITLYELTTGKRPFGGDSGYAIMAEHLQKQPVPPVEIDPRVPASVSVVIVRSLAKNPADRYQSAAEFRQDLLESLTPEEATIVMGSATAASRISSTGPQAGRPSDATTKPGPAMQAPPPQAAPAFAGAATTPSAAPHPQQAGTPAMAAAPSPATPATARKPNNTLALVMVGIIAFLMLAAVGLVFAGSWFMSSRTTTTADAQPTLWERITGGSSTAEESTITPEEDTQTTTEMDAPLADNTREADNYRATNPGSTESATPLREQPQSSVPADAPKTTARPAKTAVTTPNAGGYRQEQQVAQNLQHQSAPTGGYGSAPQNAIPEVTPQTSAPATPAVDPQALENARDFFSKLGVRAGTVQESARKLIEEQASMGMTLRADMRASLKRMEMLMDQAEASLERGNLQQASQQMESAEREIEKLEKFFRI